MRKLSTYLAAIGVSLAIALPVATAGASGQPTSVTQYKYWSLLSGAAQTALLHRFAQNVPSIAWHGGANQPRSGLTNVEVNNPSADGNSPQNTQSETSVAQSGSDVVVGFNDSTGYNANTGTGCFTGYAYSSNSGASFTDGGCIPFPSGGAGLGDPSVVADPNAPGTFYFGQLTMDANGAEYVGVSKSTDGGVTWSQPVAASPKVTPGIFGVPFQDKDWISAGINPSNHSQTILYASWSHFTLTSVSIQVSTSTNGGSTWSSPITLQSSGVGVQGSNTVEDPVSGKAYAFWEGFGSGNTRNISYSISTNGGVSWSAAKVLGTFQDGTNATVNCGGVSENVIQFIPGDTVHVARNNSFPAAAVDPSNGNVYVVANAKVNGHVNIGIASSNNGGSTWHIQLVAPNTQVQFQPWVSVDSQGVHVQYYQLTGSSSGTFGLNGVNGTRAVPPIFGSPFAVSSTTFGPAQTNPNADPVVAACYMGDYNQLASNGSIITYVWGDNRNYSVSGPDVWSATTSG